MNVPQRPLAGCVVSLSISESEETVKRGFPAWQVNRVILQIVTALFGQGASVIFGHDWRDDGVMEAMHGFAQQMQPPVPPTETEATAQPLLRNLLPWPDKPHLRDADLERLTSTLRVEAAGLPEELRSVDEQARHAEPDTPLYRYVRARGLTFLRHRLTEVCNARLCLGGRLSGFDGRYPGVIEEALLALRGNKPLYLAGLLGGATEQVVDAVDGKEMPADFCRRTPVHDWYDRAPTDESDPLTRADRDVNGSGVWAEFQEAGHQKIAEGNGLTIEENAELLHTPVLDRVIQLVLTGLSRLRTNSPL